MIQKLIRDFYQYLRNSFDSIGQIANAGLLANKGKKVDKTDFPAMKDRFQQQTYSGEFPLTSAWFSKTDSDDEFKYIDAVCNRVKHTAFINNQISIGLFGCENKMNMGAFLRNGEQHEKADLKDKMQQAIKFTEDSYIEFLTFFSAEFKNDLHVSGRYYDGIKVYQQHMKDSELSSFSLPYIVSQQHFDAMPNEIYVLLLRNNEGEIKAADCPFTSILITSADDYKTAVGRYVATAEDSEPDKKAAESLSSNAVIDTTQSKKLSEKSENETVEKSTFAKETTQPPVAETDTEKVSEEPIFSQTTIVNNKPKQDTQRQKETPESGIYESEVTTNTASEITTAVEQIERFDISYWISYAQNYAQSIGLILDETATEC